MSECECERLCVSVSVCERERVTARELEIEIVCVRVREGEGVREAKTEIQDKRPPSKCNFVTKTLPLLWTQKRRMPFCALSRSSLQPYCPTARPEYKCV